ncbi:MAG: LysR family transcriptional regulator [Clostridiales bacterium]|nr:LysR family transcriptional regulator [Clostridiales bacterium]
MTFDQLQYFVAVVESSTFFDAAESLHIAQSTLSKQIRNLELELDVQLFDRSRRHASLTEAGRALYPDAVKLLKGVQGMKQHLAPYQDSRKSIIHLGVLPILHQYRLNPILKQFTESHPEISLLIDEVEDEPLRQGFRHGSYDLVIGRPELLTGIQSTCHLLARDRLVLLTPTDHPLAGRAAVPLEELSGESFILMHPDSSIHRLCLTACQKKGFQPAVTRTAKIESIVSAVAAGEAVSLLPYSNLDVFRHENVVVIPLQEPVAANVVLACLSPKKLSRCSRTLWKYLST